MGYEFPRRDTFSVADAAANERQEFIRKTYLHLGAAIGAFALLAAFLVTQFGVPVLQAMGSSRGAWAVVLLAFAGVGWVADRLAQSLDSPAKQYAGLGLYVIAEAVVFTPILTVAAVLTPPEVNVLPVAALLTGIVFGGLTLVVFTTKKDFSFMRGALSIAMLVALGLIVCSLIFGFQLGMVFAAAMVLIAAGQVLYQTSNVLHHYPVGAHVAASLALFASVALLFFYVLRILLSLSRRN